MISVIVPIYNVEPYLRQCVDSIINQTYPDLEIILVDDGSTDGSGKIADSYDDPRIKVFHTENRGLSAARNLGIDHAHGEYISFVDADDWIEPDLLLQTVSLIDDADILCHHSIITHSEELSFTGYNALIALFNGIIPTAAWGKLYRRNCFADIRFPEGRICEDTATTYKILLHSSHIICTNVLGYHYRFRSDSLSHTHDKKNIVDFWIAVRDRFLDCKELVDGETQLILYIFCAKTILRTFAWRISIPELLNDDAFYSELSSFAKEHFPFSILKQFPLSIRIGVCIAKHPNKLSLWLANKTLLIYRYLKNK